VSRRRGRLVAVGRRAVRLFALVVGAWIAGAKPAPAQHWWEPLPTPTAEPTPQATPTPSGTRCAVTVLDAPPAEAFDLLGIIEVAPRGADASPESALEAARIQGCALGGDALVVVYQARRYRSGTPSTPPQTGVLSEPALRAAVIRYRER
jgi:hypothetical protein